VKLNTVILSRAILTRRRNLEISQYSWHHSGRACFGRCLCQIHSGNQSNQAGIHIGTHPPHPYKLLH